MLTLYSTVDSSMSHHGIIGMGRMAMILAINDTSSCPEVHNIQNSTVNRHFIATSSLVANFAVKVTKPGCLSLCHFVTDSA